MWVFGEKKIIKTQSEWICGQEKKVFTKFLPFRELYDFVALRHIPAH